MTVTLTVPDDLYNRAAEIAEREGVSAERVLSAALAEQLAQWARVQSLAGKADRDAFLAVLDKVPATEPMPEDRV